MPPIKDSVLDTSNDIRPSRDRLSDKSFNRVLMEIVGPMLIMLMVGALVFFLIEVFYRGPHNFRLRWVFGLFTAAAVLVSRISIEEGLERAAVFGFALAAATLGVTVSLVDFEYGSLFLLEPVVVAVFVGVVMWSSNRLTWDCTVIDGSRDISSIGLAELVKRKLFKKNSGKKSDSATGDESSEQTNNPSRTRRWLFMFFANSKNQNTPGLWVFYFAMAAFPIFGFGQWFAQPSPGWGYRWIFLLFAIYLGSALGLLMLTSLLGLERYLRQRGAALPASVSRGWMTVGTVFALMVMLVMLLIPSPSLSTGWQDALGFLTTNNKNKSRHAVGNDGKAEGENPQNQKVDEEAKDAEQQPGEQGEGQGDKSGKGGNSKSQSKGGDSSGDKKSKQQSDSKSQPKSKDGQKGEKSQPNKEPNNQNSNREQQDDKNNENNGGEKSGEKQDDRNPDARQNEQNKEPQDKEPQDKEPQDKGQQQNANKAQPDKQPADNRQQDDGQQNAKKQQGGQKNVNPPQPSASFSSSGISKFLASVMRFFVYVVGLIVFLVVIWMFRKELAKLWAELFGKKAQPREAGNKTIETRTPSRPLPAFDQFTEPFSGGLAAKWSAARTIQYTFEALEAWARGHEQPRDQDQTPHEFAQQLAQLDKKVGGASRKLADLFGESLYSDSAVERSNLSDLKKLWKLMIANAPRSREMQLSSES